MKRLLIIGSLLLMMLPAQAQTVPMERIATDLLNPRGVLVMPDGRLLVAEAGTGFLTFEEEERTGRLSIFDDVNGDGDYDDEGEQTPLLTNLPSYNSLTRFRTGHDEVSGIVDLVMLEDGRLFYVKDDPAAEITRMGEYRGDTGIFEYDWEDGTFTRLIKRPATTHSLVYDANNNVFWIAESGQNRLSSVTMEGEIGIHVDLPYLDSLQQPVPAGLAIDPLTGDILVSLFSGFIDYHGGQLAYMPGDAKVLRYNPTTGDLTDEITGLTTAVDVTTDEAGNIYVAELTTVWSAELMPETFDLYDPDAPPDAGGYTRFSGRVTMFPANSDDPVVLANGLDLPTNLTYHDGFLYVSTGQGTPGRPIYAPDGLTRITGEIYRIDVSSMD
jgi:hypothetical protein